MSVHAHTPMPVARAGLFTVGVSVPVWVCAGVSRAEGRCRGAWAGTQELGGLAVPGHDEPAGLAHTAPWAENLLRGVRGCCEAVWVQGALGFAVGLRAAKFPVTSSTEAPKQSLGHQAPLAPAVGRGPQGHMVKGLSGSASQVRPPSAAEGGALRPQ